MGRYKTFFAKLAWKHDWVISLLLVFCSFLMVLSIFLLFVSVFLHFSGVISDGYYLIPISTISVLFFCLICSSCISSNKWKKNLLGYTIGEAHKLARHHNECSRVISCLIEETKKTQDIQKLKKCMDDYGKLFAMRGELGALQGTLKHLPHRLDLKEKEVKNLEKKLSEIC